MHTNNTPDLPGILGKIVAAKFEEVQHRSAMRPLDALRNDIATANKTMPTRSFILAVEGELFKRRPAFIAEIKKASPSKGVLRNDADFNPAELAKSFAAAGAACLSVLTDEKWFHGHADHLTEARKACDIPILRKDFIIDPYQVVEARCMGADAVLLIAAALSDAQLAELLRTAHELDMEAVVEIHNLTELARALELPLSFRFMIGINNRDLRTFKTDLKTTVDLSHRIPSSRTVATESGIKTPDDVTRMRRFGVNAFLVGETLMTAPNPAAQLKTLIAAPAPW